MSLYMIPAMAAKVAVAAAPRRRPIRIPGTPYFAALGYWENAPYYFSNDPGAIAPSGSSVQQEFFETSYQVATVRNVLEQAVNSWEVRRGNDTGYADPLLQRDPQTAAAELFSIANMHCSVHPAACEGVNVGALVASLAAHYSQWFQNTFPLGFGNAIVAQGYAPQDYQGSSGGGGNTAYSVPALPATTAPPSSGGGGSTATQSASVAGSGASGAVSARLDNLSRPNMPLSVGDAWQLTITGPASSPVVIWAHQNGQPVGTPTPFGNTDAAGVRILSGVMTEAELGQWSESIRVGNSEITLSFVVSARAAASGSAGSAGGGASATGAPSADPGAWEVSAAGVPGWVWPAAAAAAVLLMVKR